MGECGEQRCGKDRFSSLKEGDEKTATALSAGASAGVFGSYASISLAICCGRSCQRDAFGCVWKTGCVASGHLAGTQEKVKGHAEPRIVCNTSHEAGRGRAREPSYGGRSDDEVRSEFG